MRSLVYFATLLAFCVVVLGAYVRLSDAGLGCPDWPGCYGKVVVPHPHQRVEAEARFPGKPLEAHKAWKEMIHRYLAGTLGLFILVIAVAAWRETTLRNARGLATGLLALVLFQAMLGMWTVTELLKPVIVSAHLLGGLATLSLLVWLSLRLKSAPSDRADRVRLPSFLAAVALLVLIGQVALGGWTSSNYAALACADFPTCQGRWVPPMDAANAFRLHRELGYSADGELLSLAALTAIQWTHRVGALITLLVLGTLSLRLFRTALKHYGVWLLALLLTQIGLGVANVLLRLPLPIAVLHNAVAALLLISMVVINFKLHASRRRTSTLI